MTPLFPHNIFHSHALGRPCIIRQVLSTDDESFLARIDDCDYAQRFRFDECEPIEDTETRLRAFAALRFIELQREPGIYYPGEVLYYYKQPYSFIRTEEDGHLLYAHDRIRRVPLDAVLFPA